MWPALTALALLALLALHLFWRLRFTRTTQQARLQLEQTKAAQQRELLQLQSQQKALLDSMVEGLLVLDGQGRIQLANRAFARLFQIGGDVRGQTLLEALRLHELTDLVDELSEKREPLQLELRLPGPSERWLQVNAAAIASPDNERPAALLVFHDLTRLKQLERTREEFVANVSHELRTPLSLIKGYAETLLDGAKDKPEVATRFLQTIDRNAERLKLLIEDLLTISALESGSIQLELQSVDLPALIEKVFADFRTRAHARRVRLLNQTSDLKVNADPRRLEQVLSNLIDNAIKYGRPEGQVTLGARSLAGQQVEVFVRDDGPGIPPDALDRIFERFYRVDKARSRDQGGTGLGLSIVKHIVQSHGGRIWAESSPGNGATFFFTLPQ